MENPFIVEDESITTQGKQILCLMDDDIARIRGHKIHPVDDVISTGSSLKALEKAGGASRWADCREMCSIGRRRYYKSWRYYLLGRTSTFDAEYSKKIEFL